MGPAEVDSIGCGFFFFLSHQSPLQAEPFAGFSCRDHFYRLPVAAGFTDTDTEKECGWHAGWPLDHVGRKRRSRWTEKQSQQSLTNPGQSSGAQTAHSLLDQNVRVFIPLTVISHLMRTLRKSSPEVRQRSQLRQTLKGAKTWRLSAGSCHKSSIEGHLASAFPCNHRSFQVLITVFVQ